MPRKNKPSFILTLLGVVRLSIWELVFSIIPAGIAIYEFNGGTVKMLKQVPSWVWLVLSLVGFVYVMISGVQKYNEKLEKENEIPKNATRGKRTKIQSTHTGGGDNYTAEKIEVHHHEMKLDERNSKAIRADKIKITPKEEPSKNRGDTGHYAYLEIFNGQDFDLKECYITLDVIYAKTGNGWLNFLDHLNPNHSNLSWPAFRAEDEKIIRKNKPVRVNLAKTTPGNIEFTLQDGDHPGLSTIFSSNYYIEIEINGTLDKTPIEGIVLKGFINDISRLIQEPDRAPTGYRKLYFEKGELDEKERQN